MVEVRNMARSAARLRSALRSERGTTLIELVIGMVLMIIVLGALTELAVNGSKTELALNNQFQAQSNARVALDRLRRELHCSSSVTYTDATHILLPTSCLSASQVTWCTIASGNHWQLWRAPGGTCSNAGTLLSDALTSPNVFPSYSAGGGGYLAKLSVDIAVNVNPARADEGYELKDTIALRNSSR
jgi:type II secretory pathway pseudopilin PulG